MTTYPVPSGKTARRLEWQFLPPHIRAFIEERCGSKVVAAVSQGAGFTPGFASVLTCVDGSRHFVKAASVKAQRLFADSYREEARKLIALPEAVPAPRLLWSRDDDWVVLGLEYVDGRNPRRPWRPADLDRCLDALDDLAPILTPPPAGLGLDSFADEFGEVVGYWDHVRATQPGLPHLEEAAALAAGFEDVTRGNTLVHTDLRDDNFIIDRAGKVWMCDWNWPVVGAAWIDSLFVLDRAARGRTRRGGSDRAAAAARRRTGRAHRPGPGAAGRLLLPTARRAGPAELAPPARPPVVAGRRLLGLAVRTPGLGARPLIWAESRAADKVSCRVSGVYPPRKRRRPAPPTS